MDTLTAVRFAASVMERQCVYTIQSQITDTGASNPNPPQALLYQVQDSICPSQCSGRGKCVNQRCVCEQGGRNIYVVVILQDITHTQSTVTVTNEVHQTIPLIMVLWYCDRIHNTVNVTDTISWQGHHDRVMQLNRLYFCGTCLTMPLKV